MLGVNVWRGALGVDRRTVIERVGFDELEEAIVVRVRQRRSAARRCGRCGQLARGYDQGDGVRRWRTLDVGARPAYLEACAPRVDCPTHGPTVIQVPWARHGVGHTRAFDDLVAWLAVHTSKRAITQLLAIAWVTVGAIIARVVADAQAESDPFDGLVRIGIDEISYKRHHRYLTVIVDHDTGRLVWAAPGYDRATVNAFFDRLGPERCAQITHLTCDGAPWLHQLVSERLEHVIISMDPFHVVQWATKALDEVRRDVWNQARRHGMRGHARDLKGARFALWKNPEDLTDRQAAKLAWVATLNGPLFRAYLLKEQLRQVFALKGTAGIELLHRWLAWAQRCRIGPFVELGRKIRRRLTEIEAALTHGLSNAIVESTNTKLRLLTRVAFGFKKPEHLIALAMLDRGGYCPPLPRRTTHG